jgi:hypothetical protein
VYEDRFGLAALFFRHFIVSHAFLFKALAKTIAQFFGTFVPFNQLQMFQVMKPITIIMEIIPCLTILHPISMVRRLLNRDGIM